VRIRVCIPPPHEAEPLDASSAVIPVLGYDDVAHAIDWLCETFGLALDNGAVVVTERRYAPGPVSLLVRVDDVGANQARAVGGHSRTFSESIADAAPEECGAMSNELG
jgi:hypothetical protein